MARAEIARSRKMTHIEQVQCDKHYAYRRKLAFMSSAYKVFEEVKKQKKVSYA